MVPPVQGWMGAGNKVYHKRIHKWVVAYLPGRRGGLHEPKMYYEKTCTENPLRQNMENVFIPSIKCINK